MKNNKRRSDRKKQADDYREKSFSKPQQSKTPGRKSPPAKKTFKNENPSETGTGRKFGSRKENQEGLSREKPTSYKRKASYDTGDQELRSYSKGRSNNPDRKRSFGRNQEKPTGYRKEGPSTVGKKTPARKPRPVKSDPSAPIRLNKFIANAGVCSRREADKLIETGAVKVNGVIVTELGTKVGPADKVQLGDQTLSSEKLRYVLLNKPKGFITTTDDPFKRNTVMKLVEDACRERIYPVGRLDRNTTGLLLFTNDGELTKRLTHPRFGVRKIYDVELDKPLLKKDMESIAAGVELNGETIIIDEIAYVEVEKNKKHIGIELHSGQNRVVRRIFEKFDYEVLKLDRVMISSLTKKNLPRGRWRHLDEKEIRVLKRL
ncbi:MAG TPA: rRNA pseudouridine synthase [Bacteroidales bacterium]|nr:rRNA pseudouridine synthase [Bacteroidales bacterium]